VTKKPTQNVRLADSRMREFGKELVKGKGNKIGYAALVEPDWSTADRFTGGRMPADYPREAQTDEHWAKPPRQKEKKK
jgi:hypothetical protein